MPRNQLKKNINTNSVQVRTAVSKVYSASHEQTLWVVINCGIATPLIICLINFRGNLTQLHDYKGGGRNWKMSLFPLQFGWNRPDRLLTNVSSICRLCDRIISYLVVFGWHAYCNKRMRLSLSHGIRFFNLRMTSANKTNNHKSTWS